MRYETGIQIGRGADSEVFKAQDPVNDRIVALKIFSQDDEIRMARREREARVQASLDHPSICEIYEVGTTPGGRSFIAMRYVDGEPLVLFQVLTGRLPFDATGVAAIFQVLEHEPPLAHLIHPETPTELGHIAQKAMEKDARRRYPDAGALQRDLQRYLQGAMTDARGVGVMGRWLRRAERHPRLSLAGLLLLLLALGSLAWGGTRQFIAQQQTRDAEIFARRATEIEAQARYSQLLPRHSIQLARRSLQNQTDQLADDVSRAGGRAAAAGFYALGRAELALGHIDRAAVSLDRAQRAGFDDASWHLDLALASLAGARERLREVELVKDPAGRRQLKARIRQDLRARLPTLASLAGLDLGSDGLGQGDQLLIRSLDALISERYDESRRWAQQLVELEPWRFEADLILADTYREQATSGFMGEDSTSTGRALQTEKEVLDHPDAGYAEHQNLGNALLAEAQALREVGRPSPEHYEQAAQALARGLDLALDSAFGRQSLGIVWSRHGQALDAVGRDPRPSYRRAVEAFHQGLNDISSAEARVWNSICVTWTESAYYGLRHPESAEPSSVDDALDAGRKACERALQLNPDYVSALANLGLVHWTQVEWDVVQNRDPAATYGRAQDTFVRLFELDPDDANPSQTDSDQDGIGDACDEDTEPPLFADGFESGDLTAWD